MAAILAFYRSDSTPGMRRALLGGAALVAAGALVMVVAFRTRQTADVSMAAACAGILLIVSGTVVAVVGLQRLLANESCIVVRADGIAVQRKELEDFVAWDDVEVIRAAERSIVVARRDGTALTVGDRKFGGKDAKVLAPELDAVRRKAAFRLLG